MHALVILIISAISTHRDELSEWLRQDGHKPAVASNVAHALIAVDEINPDLVISDYPLADGVEQLLSPGQHSIPLIAISEQHSEEMAIRAFRSGVADYLIRPLDRAELLDAVRRVAQQHTAEAIPARALAALISRAADAVIALDKEDNLLFCNEAARRLLCSQYDASLLPVGQPLSSITRDTGILELLKRESDYPVTEEVVLPGGQKVLSIRHSRIPELGSLIIMRDITRPKEDDRFRGEFVERVSGDIRSPLTAILGYVELLGRVGPLNEQQQAFVERACFSVHSITALLSDLLELNRIEIGLEGERNPVQFAMIVRYAVEGVRRQFETQGLGLTVSAPDHAPPVLGNPLRLRQMVYNLLDNAARYTPAGGRVTISLTVQGDLLLLAVSDTGVGIPARDQARIFDRFYRGANVTGEYSGTGLGLSIVKNIVDQHNGRIWVESQEGQGTTFTIMLPTQNNTGT